MTQRVLITGAAGGIGQATAFRFARAGARLVLTDRDADAVAAIADQLRADGADIALVSAANIADPDEVTALFAAITDAVGGLDAAFNNAGRGGGQIALDAMDDAHWLDVIQTNLSGTFYCLRAEVQMMLADRGGAIVNNSSILGLHGGMNAAYTASKHGIAGLTKSAAIQYAQRGIRVNAVCPGLIDAGIGKRVLEREAPQVQKLINMHPMARAGSADEVAAAVLWLCSAEASYMTGHMLPVDGGYGAW